MLPVNTGITGPVYLRFIVTGGLQGLTEEDLMFDTIVITQGQLEFDGTVSVSTNSVGFGWQAENGKGYRVYYCGDLVNTNWIPLGVVTAMSSTASFQDNTVNDVSNRYYRIEELP